MTAPGSGPARRSVTIDPAWAGMPGSGDWPKMVPCARFAAVLPIEPGIEAGPVEGAHRLAEFQADHRGDLAGPDSDDVRGIVNRTDDGRHVAGGKLQAVNVLVGAERSGQIPG